MVLMSFGRAKKISENFFDWLQLKLGFKEMDGWYTIKQEEINKHGGQGLLRHHYNCSPSKALQEVYPEHNWLLWKFNSIPKSYWDAKNHQREFLEWLVASPQPT